MGDEQESVMRTFIVNSIAAVAIAAAGALAAPAAQAAPVGPSAGLAAAAQETGGLTQDVAYVCRRVWRYGGWQRSCWWRPGPSYYGGYGYYGPRRYYGGHRYYRGGHRHWRRW